MRKLTTDGRCQVDERGRVWDFGAARLKMTRALSPRIRRMYCTHNHAPYSGEVPCTGPRVCSMCGAEGVVIGEAC